MFNRISHSVLRVGLVLATVLVSRFGTDVCAQATEPLALRVVTFNLRFASTNKPNSWAERRRVMHACIQEMAPDVMGTQEGVYPQLKDIAADLPEFDWIGLGRDGGSRGEFMAVFYRKARLEPVEFDHFWLSDTPNVIASTNWGNTNRRMTTWVRFRDRASGREFYVFNTHLDHAVRSAREKGALLIRQRVQELATNAWPVLLIGDFNAEPGKEKTYDLFLEAISSKTPGIPRARAETMTSTPSTISKARRKARSASIGSLPAASGNAMPTKSSSSRAMASSPAIIIRCSRPCACAKCDHFADGALVGKLQSQSSPAGLLRSSIPFGPALYRT